MMFEWITNNWALKLTSLILAIGLWNYALGEEGIEVKRTIPLEIQVENTQISLLKASTRQIRVTLLAPRALLSDIASEEIRAVHKVGGDVRSAGDYSFRLEPREIKLPTPQIQVVKIEPEVVQVTLDELIVQKLQVRPNFVGETAFGYAVDEEEIQLNPNAILIEGPKGEIEKYDAISTQPLDLVGRIRSFRRTVPLLLPINVKPLSEALIDVYVPIKEEFKERSYEAIQVKVIRPAKTDEKVTVTPPKISFVLKGSVRQLDKIDPENFLAYIDISDLKAGEHESSVQMVLPEGVLMADEKPVNVTVLISKK